jgi:hypothetical protein
MSNGFTGMIVMAALQGSHEVLHAALPNTTHHQNGGSLTYFAVFPCAAFLW